jgi:hypothetical protein
MEAEMAKVNAAVKEIEAEILWWGEPDASDIPGFFTTWLKYCLLRLARTQVP